MPRYFIYCRKSSESEDRQVLSIESQKRELTKFFIDNEKLDIVEVLEEAFSAKSPGRSVFDMMINRIEKGEADGIIAWHPDRLARNSVDGGKIIHLLDTGKVTDLKFSTYNFENSPQGKFMLNIIFGQSKYYVDALSENVKRGNRTKLENGWRPGRAPIGYLNDKAQKSIIKDPERFSIVKKMWSLMLTGNYSPPKIYEIATNKWGLRTKKWGKLGGGPLRPNSIYRIFNNLFYCGQMIHADKVYQGKHEPMVSLEEFDRVHKLLGRKGKQRPKKHIFAFTGLIRCKECGCLITAEEKINRHGSRYTYYHCTKKKSEIVCNQPSIRLEELEWQIIEYLSHITMPDRFVEWSLKYLKKKNDEEADSEKDIQKSLEKAYRQNQRDLDALIQMRYRELLSDEEYLKQKKELLKEQVMFKGKIEEPGETNRCLLLSKRLFVFANKARERFETGDLQIKRTILTTIGSNLYLKDKKFFIEAKKPFFIIENGLKDLMPSISRLEPSNSGLAEPKTGVAPPPFRSWQAQVEDVRTFFQRNETFDIPDLKASY